jgi:hypothetical protein
MTMRCKLLIALLLFFCVSSARAQFNGVIEGTVTDSRGGAIAGAKVTATNHETGTSRVTETTSEGFYRVSGLVPGAYTVTAEIQGFKKKIATGVVVGAEEHHGLDLTLEIGTVADTVTVSGSAQTLSTEDANTSGVITSREIERLPQVGRDPYELLRLTPGVFGDGARGGSGGAIGLPNSAGPGGSNSSIFQTENQVPISASGQRTSANNFTVDGVSVNSLQFGGAAVITPNQESVQDITVISSTYSAEDGRNSGAQIKVVSKSGTNDLHGSGFFKYQDPNWNSFNKYGGFDKAPPTRVNNNFRQFGGSLGGAIIKNKLFWFFSYEGLRSNNNDTSEPLFVETSQFRTLVANARPGGLVAKVFNSKGVVPRILNVLPVTCLSAGFAANQCQAVQGGLDIGSPIGATGTYVTFNGPNADPTGGGLDGIPDIQKVQLSLPSTNRGDQYNGRIDYTVGANQFAFSSYFTLLNNLTSDAGGRSRPQGDLHIQPFNRVMTLAWIRTFGPTLLNELRYNFTRFNFNQVTSNSGVNFGIPRIEIEGYNFDRIRFGADRGETTPGIFTENTFDLRDVATKTYRTQAIKFGGEISWQQNNNNLLGGARPLYSFHNVWNFANDTPIFESINASPQTGLPADAQRYFRTRTEAVFVQNDWKLRPNLTVNLGLRYEYFTPLREAKGRLTNFIPGPPGPTFITAGKVHAVSDLYPADRNNFAPRLGFAWNPHYFQSKLVWRGGFGVSYDRVPDVLFSNTHGNPPDFARFNICCGTSGSLPAQDGFGSPFAGGQILYALGSSNSATSYPRNPALSSGIDPANGGICANPGCNPAGDIGVELWGAPQNFRTPYVFNYSLEAEYQLPSQMFLSVGYQGNAGHKLVRILNQNFIAPVSSAFFAIFFPTSDENSNFNSLNVHLRRNFTQGFLFDVYYRYSKSIDQLSNEGPGAQTNQTDPAHHQTEYGPSDYDATHYFRLYGLWDLPIFRSRTDWVGKVLGGWQFNSILDAHTGFPWTPNTCVIQSVPITNAFNICPTRPTALLKEPGRSTSNSAFTTPGANFPGLLLPGQPLPADPNNPSDPLSAQCTNKSQSRRPGFPYFDICNPGAPGIGRNSFRGPRFLNVDMSLAKKFGLPKLPALGEGASIELRGNFFNIFNIKNLQPLQFNADETRIENSHFGQAPKGLAGRVIEFQARFSF